VSARVYELANGSKLITDQKVRKKGYTLKRSYATTPYRSGGGNQPYRATPIKSIRCTHRQHGIKI